MIRALFISTHQENCGIAKYLENYLDPLKRLGVDVSVFPYSPNVTKQMGEKEFASVLRELSEAASKADVVHIQHEPSFFSDSQLAKIVKTVKTTPVKLIVTLHAAPSAGIPHVSRSGLSPRALLHYYRSRKIADLYRKNVVDPLQDVDCIHVHNKAAADDLRAHGITAPVIRLIPHPIPKYDPRQSSKIHDALNIRPGEIILGMVGFMSQNKGVLDAVKALRYLPGKYKLAVVGGVHPLGDQSILDTFCDLAVSLGVEDRIYVTGYIEDDATLADLVNECDVCLYPYNPAYYSYVASGAAGIAIGLQKPSVMYPISTFNELNENQKTCEITKSCNYYEIARSVGNADLPELKKNTEKYAMENSYDKAAKSLVAIYEDFIAR